MRLMANRFKKCMPRAGLGLVFAIVGFALLPGAGAATFVATKEAELATPQLPAVSSVDSNASGGMAVRFQAASNPTPAPAPSATHSLRFYGTQTNDIDRVKIPLTPNKSVDVGGSFTLEWWMKTASGNTMGGACQSGGSVFWVNGNIIWDRDVDGAGDIGDYGISLFSDGRLSFGVENAAGVLTICSTASVSDGQWHHVAATRNTSSGQLCLYVDGSQSTCGVGPIGDIGYRDGRATNQPNSDPFLVIGAEKHDYWTSGQGYHGWVDEARISNAIRYTVGFNRPSSAFTSDANTVALYHFDEGSGATITDTVGDNNGQIKVGGPSNGPQWSSEVAF